ncbi:hypothetical protein BC831DRAFT_508731 [Entophlyctis helioformis]|nr:hypothetical protein BC831DRAFT_508731 [Entophlyctis helioformis]
MKQRFSALDVSASVAELSPRLAGMRLQNVYDLNQKTYLFKFSRGDAKDLLLIESGIRMHSTQFARDKSNTPSNFCAKLRKHLRTKWLKHIRQLGTDRAIDMQFGDGEYAFHVIVEFYASGNIILTDHSFRILSLLRVDLAAEPGTGQVANAAKGAAGKPSANGKDKNAKGGKSGAPPAASATAGRDGDQADELDTRRIAVGEIYDAGGKKGQQQQQQKPQKQDFGAYRKKKRTKTLKNVLREKLGADYGPAVVDHCIVLSGLDPAMALPDESIEQTDGDSFKALLAAFVEGDNIITSCQQTPQPGFITLKAFDNSKPLAAVAAAAPAAPASDDTAAPEKQFVTYDEFHPVLFAQFAASQPEPSDAATPPAPLEFASFDKCVDMYFSKLESQKLEMRARQAEMAAIKKIEGARASHANQIRNFQIAQEANQVFASAIEYNLDAVESVLQTVRSFLASGMDWIDLEELVREETARGNALARIIVGFKLHIGMITIALPDPMADDDEDADDADDDDDDDEDDSEDGEDGDDEAAARKSSKAAKAAARSKRAAKKKDELLKIDINVFESAFANARRYYDAKKTAAVKEEKTLDASSKALKTVERKAQKFWWFISSENYLVVGGRDAGQNEMLVRRYLKKGDAYVHADLHGAATVIVKNVRMASVPADAGSGNWSAADAGAEMPLPPPVAAKVAGAADEDIPIPPTTLLQAGTMSVCQSRAWDSKVVMAAYWVHPHQVSKTAPTGEYLTTGSFMIRGKKNWLPPIQLVYGMALLFKVDESCIGRHYWERRPWGRDGTATAVAADAEDAAAAAAGQAGQDDDDDDDDTPDMVAEDAGDANDGQDDEEGEGQAEQTDIVVEDVVEQSADGGDAAVAAPAEVKGDDEDDDEDMEFPDTQIDASAAAVGPAASVATTTAQSKATARAGAVSHGGQGMASKYAVSDDDEAEAKEAAVEQAIAAGKAAAASGKRHLSAKERRLLKKQQQQGGSVADASSVIGSSANASGPASVAGVDQDDGDSDHAKNQLQEDDDDENDHDASAAVDPSEDAQSTVSKASRPSVMSTAASIAASTASAAAVRGKRGKLKKLKEKYADQDEEERELMLDLLGSSKGPQPKGKKAKALAVKLAEDERKRLQHLERQKQQEHKAKQQKEQREKQHNSSSDAEIKRILDEENVALPDDEQVANMSYLDSLTGQPHPDDILLHAVPMCAPWGALQKYKYKVKLLPGALKRGKAAKSVTAAFLTVASADAGPFGERQKELIRAVPDAEWLATVLGKVKVVAPGSESAKKGSGKKKGGK